MKSNPLEYIITGVIFFGLVGLGFLLLFRPEVVSNNPGAPASESQLLARAGGFIEHRLILSQITLDTNFFNDSRFRQLRNDRSVTVEQPIGKPQLFDQF